MGKQGIRDGTPAAFPPPLFAENHKAAPICEITRLFFEKPDGQQRTRNAGSEPHLHLDRPMVSLVSSAAKKDDACHCTFKYKSLCLEICQFNCTLTSKLARVSVPILRKP